MPRFFVGEEQIRDGVATVLGDDARHIARSLRMAVGEEITVIAPDGTEYACTLSRIRDDEVTAEVVSSRVSRGESPCRIRLFMAYPKGDKLETVVQKATELGASEITPFDSEFCVRKPRPDKLQGETERLNRIAKEAAKQCRRGRIPTVTMPLSFADMLRAAGESSLVLFCYEGEGTVPLPAVLPDAVPASVAVIVGSEGGFSEREAALCREAGFVPVGLGERILRCETAPLFALSCISFRYELTAER